MTEMNQTPNGTKCLVLENDQWFVETIMECCKGSWQRLVARNLLKNGYIIRYKADGHGLRGKARSYQSKYHVSVDNLMERIGERIAIRNVYIAFEPIGPKGAFGYYVF